MSFKSLIKKYIHTIDDEFEYIEPEFITELQQVTIFKRALKISLTSTERNTLMKIRHKYLKYKQFIRELESLPFDLDFDNS